MGKYSTLGQHLNRQSGTRLTMDFDAVAEIVSSLPASAFRYDEWWANDASGIHAQANGWLDAGWRVSRVDRRAKRVTFVVDGSSS
jgi:hypothetical protein